MSSQLQVSGEAKIRDIQGPVVANSGVITALDGAASQYVRGDGTLADFPTSSGGGSSVSYYLNSSVSQGTIGGVAYRELSKEPIIGAGTDIAISANGYVASYLTDANDPDVLSIPGGNFNCEFYFSVNNNTGNPFFYAELYKYDGTTFTLLGSSVGVPEYINQGTIIAPYYFAIPVPTSALAVTDRLAIRIYVNVDSRTVTLHTENSHLCQVVTTLSKGMVSLNNLTDQSQYITTGTSGTDFNIVSSGDTHTFNIPSASASNRGLITTGSQTIAGIKTLSVPSQFEQGLYLKQNMNLFQAGYIGLGASTTGLIVGLSGGGFGTLNFNNTTSFTYTFPDATGTIALLEGTQTFTGAKTFTQNLSLDGNGSNAGTLLLKSNSALPTAIGYTGINSTNNSIYLTTFVSNPKTAALDLSGLSDNIIRTFTFPNASGTLALTSNLSSYVPYTGATTNVDLGARNLSSYAVNVNGDGTSGGALNLKMYNSLTLAGVGYLSIYAQTDYYFALAWNFVSGTKQAIFNNVLIPINNTRYYNLPNADGTLALTSNLSAYLPLSGGTLTGALSGTSATFSGNGSFGTVDTTLTIGGVTNTNTEGKVRLRTGSTKIAWEIGAQSLVDNALTITPSTAAGGTTFTTPVLTISSTGDATFSSTVLVGNGAAQTELRINSLGGTNQGPFMRFQKAGSNKGYIGTYSAIISGTSDDLTYYATGAQQWMTNNTTATKMLLDTSGNLGIGTNTPNANTGTSLVVYHSSTPRIRLTNSTTGQAAGDGSELSLFNSDFNIENRENGAMNFYVNGGLRQTITSGGNVGIGTSSPTYKLDVYGGASGTRTDVFVSNAAANYNIGVLSDNNGFASSTNAMLFYTAANERMRITSGGNVAIGTSAPLGKLSVKLATATAVSTIAGTTGWDSTYAVFGNPDSVTGQGFGIGVTNTLNGINLVSLNPTSDWVDTNYYSRNHIFYGGGIERMRITSGGNVGIGTSSPSGILQVQGVQNGVSGKSLRLAYNSTYYVDYTENSINCYNNDFIIGTGSSATERMRITSVGELLIGISSGNPGQNNTTTGCNFSGGGRFFLNNSGSDNIIGRNTDGILISWRRAGVEVGTINVTSSATAYNTSSDYRLKEDLKEINGLEKVSAIKVYDFKWKADESRMDGVLAHELAEVLPYAVTGEKDGKQMQGVDYSKLVPILVKSIQELEARIKQLENK